MSGVRIPLPPRIDEIGWEAIAPERCRNITAAAHCLAPLRVAGSRWGYEARGWNRQGLPGRADDTAAHRVLVWWEVAEFGCFFFAGTLFLGHVVFLRWAGPAQLSTRTCATKSPQ